MRGNVIITIFAIVYLIPLSLHDNVTDGAKLWGWEN